MRDLQKIVNEETVNAMVEAYVNGGQKLAVMTGYIPTLEDLRRLQAEANIFAADYVYGL